jgi:hypothetical protein
MLFSAYMGGTFDSSEAANNLYRDLRGMYSSTNASRDSIQQACVEKLAPYTIEMTVNASTRGYAGEITADAILAVSREPREQTPSRVLEKMQRYSAPSNLPNRTADISRDENGGEIRSGRDLGSRVESQFPGDNFRVDQMQYFSAIIIQIAEGLM